MTATAPVCPHCGSTNTMHGGYDRDDEGHLQDTWQCRDCDEPWNTPVTGSEDGEK